MQVYQVEVVHVRPVRISQDPSLIGVGAGAIAGGVAGSMIGQGKSSILTAVGGAVAGGILGNEVEKKVSNRPSRSRGLEITVRTRSGQTWAVVQTDNGENFYPGEQVRMMVTPDSRIIAR
ncbi:MAG: hypothetical protein RLZZ399_2116 [Verrucomicrobiota bacterium]|jgi:outer membrane lipoprotein SlyB